MTEDAPEPNAKLMNMVPLWVRSFLIGLASTLMGSTITGLFVYIYMGEQYERRVEAATNQYVAHLRELILVANQASPDRAVVHARAIVATTSDFKGTLISTAGLLNSEIEDLKIYLENTRNGDVDLALVGEKLEILKLKWPAKETQVKNQLRKLLTELGLGRLPRPVIFDSDPPA